MDTNIQSDDLRHRVQQLELRLCGSTMDPVLSSAPSDLTAGGRRSALGHARPVVGLPFLDRLDQLDRDFEGVSRVANKAKVPAWPSSLVYVMPLVMLASCEGTQCSLENFSVNPGLHCLIGGAVAAGSLFPHCLRLTTLSQHVHAL